MHVPRGLVPVAALLMFLCFVSIHADTTNETVLQDISSHNEPSLPCVNSTASRVPDYPEYFSNNAKKVCDIVRNNAKKVCDIVSEWYFRYPENKVLPRDVHELSDYVYQALYKRELLGWVLYLVSMGKFDDSQEFPIDFFLLAVTYLGLFTLYSTDEKIPLAMGNFQEISSLFPKEVAFSTFRLSSFVSICGDILWRDSSSKDGHRWIPILSIFVASFNLFYLLRFVMLDYSYLHSISGLVNGGVLGLCIGAAYHLAYKFISKINAMLLSASSKGEQADSSAQALVVIQNGSQVETLDNAKNLQHSQHVKRALLINILHFLKVVFISPLMYLCDFLFGGIIRYAIVCGLSAAISMIVVGLDLDDWVAFKYIEHYPRTKEPDFIWYWNHSAWIHSAIAWTLGSLLSFSMFRYAIWFAISGTILFLSCLRADVFIVHNLFIWCIATLITWSVVGVYLYYFYEIYEKRYASSKHPPKPPSKPLSESPSSVNTNENRATSTTTIFSLIGSVVSGACHTLTSSFSDGQYEELLKRTENVTS